MISNSIADTLMRHSSITRC